MSEYGYLREDSDGHWYLIPEDKLNHFIWISEKIDLLNPGGDDWEDACQDMIDNFDECRLSGGPYDVRIKLGE